MNAKLTILGSGTSTGIPILGCNCKVCHSQDVKNQRLRTSALITTSQGKNILIDTTPDMRTQLLRAQVNHIDAVILTHDHADHVHGIDDLRAFCFKRNTPLPVFTYEKCAQRLTEKFPYIFNQKDFFKDRKILGGGIPKLSLNIINSPSSMEIESEFFDFFQLPHGYIQTTGFIWNKLAYIVDCQTIPEHIVEKLKERKLDLLILDCNGPTPHDTHLHFEQSILFAKRIGAKQTKLIHITHDFDHQQLIQLAEKSADASISPCYDGEIIYL
jgi:phosphoribosyl 1,2-cyclic phosphate phosphodiesterase